MCLTAWESVKGQDRVSLCTTSENDPNSDDGGRFQSAQFGSLHNSEFLLRSRRRDHASTSISPTTDLISLRKPNRQATTFFGDNHYYSRLKSRCRVGRGSPTHTQCRLYWQRWAVHGPRNGD